MMKKLLLLTFVFLLFSDSPAVAGDFTGIITFRKIDGNDTVFYKYFVSENTIRVEDVKKNGEINGVMLINLDNSKIVLLSGIKKIYKDFPPSLIKLSDLELDIEKTKEKMKVANQDCILWKATNKISGEKSEFWVSKKNYTFFNPMLRVLNRKDVIAHTWLEMEMSDNVFPMIGIQYDSDGKIITKIEVTQVESKNLPEDLFVVPPDFELMEMIH